MFSFVDIIYETVWNADLELQANIKLDIFFPKVLYFSILGRHIDVFSGERRFYIHVASLHHGRQRKLPAMAHAN